MLYGHISQLEGSWEVSWASPDHPGQAFFARSIEILKVK